MHLADKLLILLNVNPAANKLGVSRDELCLQLGRNWEDLKETVGILRSFGWVNCGKRYSLEGMGTHEMEYWLTADGNKELDRRIKHATANSNREKIPMYGKKASNK